MGEHHELPLFPLNTVLFPGMTLALHIFEERYKTMIERCIEQAQPFGVVLMRTGDEIDRDSSIYDIGTTAHITQVERLPDERMNIMSLGYRRFQIHMVHNHEPYLIGLVEDFPLEDAGHPEVKKTLHSLTPLLQRYMTILATIGKVEAPISPLPDDPETLAFLAAIILRAPMADKQALLTIPDLPSLLHTERQMLLREAQILKLMLDSEIRWRRKPRVFSDN